jgi:hypothetical protein
MTDSFHVRGGELSADLVVCNLLLVCGIASGSPCPPPIQKCLVKQAFSAAKYTLRMIGSSIG